MKKIKLFVLSRLFNPYYRILFVIGAVYYYMHLLFIIGSPILVKTDYLLLSILLIVLQVLFLIVLLDTIGDIIINNKLNKKQSSFIEKWSLIFTAPIALPLISNLFNINYNNPFLYTILASFAIFFFFHKTIKSIRYSILGFFAFFILIKFILQKDVSFLLESLLISNFFLAFILRYAEIDPPLKYYNKEIENFIEYMEEKYNKLKEIKNNIFIKYSHIIIINDDFFLLTKKGIKTISNNKANKDIYKDIKKLMILRKNLFDIRISRVDVLSKLYNQILKKSFNNKIINKLLIKMWDIYIEKIKKSIIKNKKNYLGMFFLISFSLFIFNPKIMRRVSNIIYKDYYSLSPKFRLKDNKRMWKSDLKLDLYNEYSEEDEFYINTILRNFIRLPSDKGLVLLKKRINIALENSEKFDYRKVADERYNNAKKLYGKNSYLMRGFSGYKSIKTSIYDRTKYFEDLNKIINSA